MDDQKFDWIKYLSDTFELGLPWAALIILVFIILYKVFEKLLDKKLDKFGKQYEKELEFIYLLKDKAINNCRQILLTLPRLRDLLISHDLSNEQIQRILEQVHILEDEIRSLRIIVSETNKDYLILHNWKTKVLDFIAAGSIDRSEKYLENYNKTIEGYQKANEAINNIIKKITN